MLANHRTKIQVLLMWSKGGILTLIATIRYSMLVEQMEDLSSSNLPVSGASTKVRDLSRKEKDLSLSSKS